MVFEDIVENFCKIVGVNTCGSIVDVLHVITNNMQYHYHILF